jgi:hypothetical protein
MVMIDRQKLLTVVRFHLYATRGWKQAHAISATRLAVCMIESVCIIEYVFTFWFTSVDGGADKTSDGIYCTHRHKKEVFFSMAGI